jgi:hypothetical protein
MTPGVREYGVTGGPVPDDRQFERLAGGFIDDGAANGMLRPGEQAAGKEEQYDEVGFHRAQNTKG